MIAWRAEIHGSASWEYPEPDAEITEWQEGDERGWRYRLVGDGGTAELVFLSEGRPVMVNTFAPIGADGNPWLQESLQFCGGLATEAGFVRTSGTSEG
jgi:hypothetical protein